ncbi:MAG TPA: Flp pilus assembly protein CpaB [Jiangellaceae bacterium]|nr:Flp pilus assembly protein CpaB [Jiangellaceae bacterium]
MDDGRLGRLRRLARTVGWHRRLLAAGLAAGAVALALQAAEPKAIPTLPVLTAARDLPGGVTLGPDDVRVVDVPSAAVGSGVLGSPDAAVGRVLAGPVRSGEPLTDVRLLGPGLLAGWGNDVVATPVRVADPGVVGLIQPGDRVDLLAAPASGGGEVIVVARSVPVLAVPSLPDQGVLAEGALLVVAATNGQAAAAAQAAVSSRLSVALRPR